MCASVVFYHRLNGSLYVLSASCSDVYFLQAFIDRLGILVSWEEDRSIKDAVRLIITELFNWLDRIAAANPKYEHIVKMGKCS